MCSDLFSNIINLCLGVIESRVLVYKTEIKFMPSLRPALADPVPCCVATHSRGNLLSKIIRCFKYTHRFLSCRVFIYFVQPHIFCTTTQYIELLNKNIEGGNQREHTGHFIDGRSTIEKLQEPVSRRSLITIGAIYKIKQSFV